MQSTVLDNCILLQLPVMSWVTHFTTNYDLSQSSGLIGMDGMLVQLKQRGIMSHGSHKRMIII